MSRGIAVIEMDSAEKLGQPEMLAGLAPTGNWFIVSDERFKEIAVMLYFDDNHVIPVLANRSMFVEPKIYERFRPQDLVEKPLTYRHRRKKR